MLKLSPKILFLLLSIVILSNKSTVNGAKLKCGYNFAYFGIEEEEEEKAYYCGVVNNGIYTGERLTIDSVEGDHHDEKKNTDVKEVYFYEIPLVKFIPRNLENIFENLIAFSVFDCNLQEIKQEDIKVFPKLQLLQIKSNKITTIEKDLFKFNPELRRIDLRYNQISHIDPNVFDHLVHLSLLFLSVNNCKNEIYSAQSRSEMVELIKQVRNGGCTNDDIMQQKEESQEQVMEDDINKVNYIDEDVIGDEQNKTNESGCSNLYFEKIAKLFIFQLVITILVK